MDWKALLESLEPPAELPQRCCGACGFLVDDELRRGRCSRCYGRWMAERPVGDGAVCGACGERRRSCLQALEIFGGFTTLCGNCLVRMGRLESPPRTLLALRLALWRRPPAGSPADEVRIDEHPELVVELSEWDVELGDLEGEETLVRGR